MSSPAPSKTPEHAPPASSNPNIRRSFTLPARIANKPRTSAASTNGADGIETLFVCASTKIVSFTAASQGRRSSPSRRHGTNSNDGPSQTIPWKSITERTLAVGALRIYRVTASNVSFLNSGNLLHTIFPRSQCWCVDGESTFVLRVRQDSYYRIELPHESEEDKERVDEFKAALSQVLQYEKTQCPFTRGFDAELPERPKTPPRRRPKRPPGEMKKAKKWLFDKTWVPEDGPRPSTPVLEGSDSGTISSYEEDDRSSINTDTSEVVPESPETNLDATPSKPLPMPSVSERAKIFQGIRSATAPIEMSMGNSSISTEPIVELSESQDDAQAEEITEAHKPSADTTSLLSSTDSFYSLDSPAHGSPSPPFLEAEAGIVNPWTEEHSSQKEAETRGRGRHRRHTSEATVRAPSTGNSGEPAPVSPTVTTPTIDVHPSSAPSTPPLISDSDEDSLEPPFLDVPTPPDTIRMKRLTGASQRRAFSPMPHPQNLFCPPKQGPRKQFTTALIRKTCEIVLGPPAHLVTLMLRIAANISNGFGFNTYRVRQSTEKIPCSWESSDEDEWAEEDDFGIPLHNLDGSTLRRRGFSGEVD